MKSSPLPSEPRYSKPGAPAPRDPAPRRSSGRPNTSNSLRIDEEEIRAEVEREGAGLLLGQRGGGEHGGFGGSRQPVRVSGGGRAGACGESGGGVDEYENYRGGDYESSCFEDDV